MLTWTKATNGNGATANWVRGSVQVYKTTMQNTKSYAAWKFEVFENGKIIDSGWTFTKKSAQHAAEVHVPRSE